MASCQIVGSASLIMSYHIMLDIVTPLNLSIWEYLGSKSSQQSEQCFQKQEIEKVGFTILFFTTADTMTPVGSYAYKCIHISMKKESICTEKEFSFCIFLMLMRHSPSCVYYCCQQDVIPGVKY